MKLIFDQDKNTGEYYAVDKDTLKEYLVTKDEFEAGKLQPLDPDGKPRWETYRKWK